MRKLILIALLPVLLLSCQNQNKEAAQDKQDKQKENKSDIQASTLIEKGQEVPDFSFNTIDGESYTISDLEGKIVLLNFFATWCPSCMEEMPALEKQIWEQYKDHEEFFMVSIGREHTMKDMKEFQEKKGYSFNFAPDTGRVIYGKFAEKYIPRNVVVDKKGNIIYQCTGYEKEDFKEMLGILEKKLK
jgi:peroxiredoxin